MKNTPRIICDECNGEGTVEMNESLQATLTHFEPGRMMTAAEIHQKDTTVSVNAINNRLEKLRHAKFLDRVKRGRFWKYSLAPKSRRGIGKK